MFTYYAHRVYPGVCGGIKERIYAYDAYMLALCEQHAAPLLSVDLRLRRVARKRDIEVLPAAIEGDERFQ